MQPTKAHILQRIGPRRRRGSEAVEMIATTAMLLTLILVLLTIMAYLIEYNQVNFATKQCARSIEITGTVPSQSELDMMFRNLLGDTEFLPREARNIEIEYIGINGGNKVQLKDTFTLTGEAIYRIHLINPGYYNGFKIDMPIHVHVVGMSEVYFPK